MKMIQIPKKEFKKIKHKKQKKKNEGEERVRKWQKGFTSV